MVPSGHHVRAILSRGDFRRLLTTRVTSQFADGLFQAALAGSVLFNPDERPDPLAVALGFAVLLLPYSLAGPFVGVLLDRWSRRNVLVAANLVRAAMIPVVALLVWNGSYGLPFLLLALLVIGVNRFVLAGLSASVPHVTEVDHLATANALSTTCGTLAFACGIGGAVGLGAPLTREAHGYALIALISIAGYVASSLIARGFHPGHLGPDADERAARPSVAHVLDGMLAGCRHLYARPSAGNALLVITAHRLFFGASTMATLLLYRNYFDGHGFFRGGEIGLGQVFAVSALGALIAASVTPKAIRRTSPRLWVTSLLVMTAAAQILLGGVYRPETLLPAAALTALAAQGIKIVVDTTVQYECDDEFQGRVFSVYDTMFNMSFVGGLLIGALTLPVTGRSYAVLIPVSLGYAVVGIWYAWATRRWPGRLADAIHEVHGEPVGAA